MNYFKTTDLNGGLEHLWKHGVSPGNEIGWSCFKNVYTVKLQGTTYVNGISSHGKTIFLLNILVNLSKSCGWKHAIWSPETGNKERQLAEIMHTWSGKSMRDGVMTKEEMFQYQAELSQYFYFIDLKPQDLNIEAYLKTAVEMVKNEGINTFLLDPWNELIHYFGKFNGREDKYLQHWLGKIRRFAEEYNLHVFIIAHPKEPGKDKDGNLKPPSFYDLAGGHSWSARAMNIICVHRPDKDEEGNEMPYHNQTDILVQKIKPKEVGSKGNISLWFDKDSNRFYDKDATGNKIFAEPFKDTNELLF